MSTISGFEVWLSGLDLTYWGDVESLANSVALCQRMGIFVTSQAPNADRWFVKADDYDETLILASEKAMKYFRDYIEKIYCNGESIEGWCSYMRQMERDQAA